MRACASENLEIPGLVLTHHPGMTEDRHMRSPSRGMTCPKFCKKTLPSKSEGAGKTGCAPHPRSHVRYALENAAHEHTGLAEASGLPCAMALRLIRFRPGDRLSCHHRLWKLSLTANLTPAPGRRTRTISPYATAALVSAAFASTAPCPSFATMANAPLAGQDGGSPKSDLPDGASGIFFCEGLDPYPGVICPSGSL
jgi:hypothetical protein